MPYSFAGKSVLVTGAGSRLGVGFAMAQLFAREGATVMLTDLDIEVLEAGARTIQSEGGSAIARVLDVSDANAWDEAVEHLITACGSVDVLVNNAGIYRGDGVADMSLDSLDAQISINLRGTLLGCRAVVPHMRKAGGAIVNVSSITALIGVNKSVAYSATKGAVRSLTKSIAIDEAPFGIRCNSIHPGTIDTGMTRALIGAGDEAAQALAAHIPLGRLGTPRDVAKLCLFLASDDASFITGGEFVVDGGQTVG